MTKAGICMRQNVALGLESGACALALPSALCAARRFTSGDHLPTFGISLGF
jgi:hypothetical protein